MLTRLRVRNLVVIPALEVTFGPGLTVLTGESGSGKSVLLGALGLALGARASGDRIRPGAERAEAAAEFTLPAEGDAVGYLQQRDLTDGDDPTRCLTRRTLDAKGRSRAFVNDIPVTRATLAGLGQCLLDAHAQGEASRMARREVQIAVLDDFGVPAASRRRLAGVWRDWRRAREAQEALGAADDDGATLLDYQLRELDDLDPLPGEYASIDAEHARLSQVDALRDAALRAAAVLAATDDLRSAASELGRLGDSGPGLDSAREGLDSALELIDAASGDLRRYGENLAPDPERLAVLDERIARMHDIARKHRAEPGQLPAIRARIAGEIADRASRQDRHRALAREADRLQAAWRAEAQEVRRYRQAAAPEFAEAVGRRMQALGIRGGSLSVGFADACTERGMDSVEFRITTRPGHPPGPLGRVASGGEQARIALAVTMVAAERSALPCLVLDEADIGVGGVTADTVGRLLRRLADRTQVICITHAPQVAAFGDRHLAIGREGEDGVVITDLAPEDRIEELARMLSGARITAQSRENARALLAGRQE